MAEEEADAADQNFRDRWSQHQDRIVSWLRRLNWTAIIAVLVVIVAAVMLRAAWEHQARHDLDRQCAALHLLQQDSDARLYTTDVAASARFQLLDADRALQQLHAEGFLRRSGEHGNYPGYTLRVPQTNITRKCQHAEYQEELRDQKHWRIS